MAKIQGQISKSPRTNIQKKVQISPHKRKKVKEPNMKVSQRITVIKSRQH